MNAERLGLRAGVHPAARLRSRPPREGLAALRAGDVHAAPSIRRRRLLAPVRDLLHERPDDARPAAGFPCTPRTAGRTTPWSSPGGPGARTPSCSPPSSTCSSSATASPACRSSARCGRRCKGSRPVARRRSSPGSPARSTGPMSRDSTSRSTARTARSSKSDRTRDDVPEAIRPCVIRDLDEIPLPTRPIVPFVETTHDRIAIEIMRGCPWQCRFCQSTVIKRPLRYRTVETIVQAALESYREHRIRRDQPAVAVHQRLPRLRGTGRRG